MKHERYESIRRVISRFPTLIAQFLEKPDYQNEIDFWQETLASRPASISDPAHREAAFPEYLKLYIHELKKIRDTSLKLLEIGPGPVSLLSAGVDQGLFEITAIDPLADIYKKIMQQNNLTYPVKPVKGYGERLLKYFEKDSFDIVYSSNALDHTISPRECMVQMSQVVTQGGVIFLEGFLREGSNAAWNGLHQHDLFPENGHLIHCNRAGKRADLASSLPLQCIYEKIMLFKDRSINAFGYEVPLGLDPRDNWQFRDWYVIVFRKT
ncbi:MAG: class I SAM-dependent methyltransferase [Gammaproteobacteria bacterium]|nr:class I SAM-dependent methyltransferase [Gammaproteobacteria bacterium]MDH3378346.1 class I SAM-dependent methyltransferase [Gammaproteobacteria bacterium]